jgi:hypothetical protein
MPDTQQPHPRRHPFTTRARTTARGAAGVAAAAGLTLLLAACNGAKSGHVDDSDPASSGTGSSSGPKPAGAATTKPAPKPKPTQTGVGAFGQTYTWNDGIKVLVSKPKAYTPSQYAAGTHPGDSAVQFTVQIINGGKKPFDTALFNMNLKAGADGVAAEQVFDESTGDGFSGTVLPGSKATAKFAFDIPKGAGKKLDLEGSPDAGIDYNSAHWIGTAP